MKIIISPKAEKRLKKIPKLDQIAIARKIRKVAVSSGTNSEEKLKGFTHVYRIRSGNYRVVYKKTTQTLYIILINHRKDVYQVLKHLLD